MKTETRFSFILALTFAFIIIVTVQPGLAGDGITRYWGVFAGISDYQTLQDLNFSADDPISIYNLFLEDSRWDSSRMILLTNSQASRAGVENAITAMASNSDNDDICVFFFSGHGGQANFDHSPFDEPDGKDEYICCWDSNLTNYSGDFIDDDLGETLSQIRGTLVVMLDTCHSGGNIKAAISKSDSGKTLGFQNIKFIMKPFEQHSEIAPKSNGFASELVSRFSALKDADDLSNIVVLTSSNQNEVSFENFGFKQSQFTYFLLQGLKSNDANSNGNVSAEEAFLYLQPALINYSISSTPQIYDGKTGQVDLLKPTAERLVFIGAGDFYWRWPFITYWKKGRAEYVYTQSQLGQGGYIKALKIFAIENPTLPLNNCTIRMKHTNISEYGPSPQWTSNDWITVYTGTKSIGDFGPVSFTLSTPFQYDGISNLIIDISFSNPDFNDSGLFYGTFSDRYSMIFHGRDDDIYGDPTSWAGTSPTPVRDENLPGAAGSYVDLEIEFNNKKTSQGTKILPFIPLLLLDEGPTSKPVRPR